MLTNVVCPGPVSSLTGIQFGDNGGQEYVTEDNGLALATTEVFKMFEIIVWRIKIRFLINQLSVLGFIHSGAVGGPGLGYLK